MNFESHKLMTLGLTYLAQRRVLAALLFATTLPAPSFSQGTAEQRVACTPDALRFCSAFIPNADEITICLREKRAELSDACRTVFEARKDRLPDVESTGARKHRAR
jgi:hypothetical protein